MARNDRRSLVGWLGAMFLPLATLLVGFAAIEHWYFGYRNFLIGFWYHSGTLALSYVFALHWTESRRGTAAARAALSAAAEMTLATVVLTGLGFVSLMIFLILRSVLPPAAAFLMSFASMASLAGAAWGIYLEHVVEARRPHGPYFLAGSRMHPIWGSLAGPAILLSQILFTSAFGPALTTAAAGLALAGAAWRLRLRFDSTCR